MIDTVVYEFETLEEISRAFTLTAEALCGEIDAFRPDLVIALAHSGWLPVSAAQARWESTRRRPFPPVTRTNIGREKTALFAALPDEKMRTNWDMGVTNRDAAYLLYQAEGKTEWTAALRQQVEAALGPQAQPERLLFVDEFSYSGKTAYLVLDLAEKVFPAANIRLVSANLEAIGEGMLRVWLKDNHPQLMDYLPHPPESALAPFQEAVAAVSVGSSGEEVVKRWRASLPERIVPEKLFHEMAVLVPGTEDVSPNSLEWRFIRPGGAALEALHQRGLSLSEAEWLELPAWAERLVREAGRREPALRLGAYARRGLLAPHRICPEQRILARAFKEGMITRDQAAEAAQLSPASAARLLSDLVDYGDLYPVGRGGGRVYRLAPDMFGKPSLPEGGSLFDQLNAFWLVPGRLLIVPRLLGSRDACDEWLAENRINHFIYIDQPGRDNPSEYRKLLEAHWPPPLPKVRLSGMGQSFYPDTNPEGLTESVDQIRKALQRGDNIVLSENTYPERSGMLAAAYLIGEGHTPESAFRRLDELRAHLPGAWQPYPARAWMRRLVRTWARGRVLGG